MNSNKPCPLVSVCCITYNHENYIGDALKSFLMQITDFPIEIIVHDDASTDDTAKKIKKYEEDFPDKLIPIYQTENQWSKGIKPSPIYVWPKARGKYIALCEGDDYWTDPYKLQKQVDFLETHADYGLVHTDVEYVDPFSNPIPPPQGLHANIRERVFNGHIFDYYLNHQAFILTVSCMFKKCLLDMDGARQWFVYDQWLIMEIARKSKVYFIPEKTCAYRRNPDGLMMSNQAYIQTRAPYALLDQLVRFYDKKSQTLKYYLENPQVEKEIVKCYTKLLYGYCMGRLKNRQQLAAILKKNLRFMFKIPLCAIGILFKKVTLTKP